MNSIIKITLISILAGCFNRQPNNENTVHNDKLKWVVRYRPTGECSDSISYLTDSNIFHGIRIWRPKIYTVHKDGSETPDSMWDITEFWHGDRDGLCIDLNSERKVIGITNYLKDRQVGYAFEFYANGRLKKLDSISSTDDSSAILPWELDSNGVIEKRGNIKNVNLLKVDISKREYRYFKKLKHNIIDSVYWYWY